MEAEFRHEAEVVRQVRESDLDYPATSTSSALSSPQQLATTAVDYNNLDDIPEDDAMMMDTPPTAGLGVLGGGGGGGGGGSSFKQQALRNSKGKDFWDTFSETSNGNGSGGGSGGSRRGGGVRLTPPPPLFGLLATRAPSATATEDLNMDSPSAASSNGTGTGTPGQQAAVGSTTGGSYVGVGVAPSAAEITRRINNKRRRADDAVDTWDPVSFKRRAVSPGMMGSVHNSPVMQSPLQRDVGPWGTGGLGSRPGSVGGDGTGKSGAASETGSQTGSMTRGAGGGGGNGGGGNKGRVGYQGMIDTNDGITKLSIE